MEEQVVLELLEHEHGPTDEDQRRPDAARALAAMRGAIRAQLQHRPYLLLGGVWGLGVAAGGRAPGLRALVRAALRSGVSSVLGEVLESLASDGLG